MTPHPRRRIRATVDPTSPLSPLALTFTRCRTRVGRRWREYQTIDEKRDPDASAAAHQLWSDTVDEALAIAEAISRQSAKDISDLLIQFETAWWWILEDDSILDGSARRWLSRFRRSLRRVATAN